MKVRVLAVLVVLMIASAMAFTAATVKAATIVKIGVMDLQKALNATTDGMAAKETLRRKHQGKQDQIDALKAELDAMEEKLKSPVLSEGAQADLKEKYARKRAEIIEFVTLAKEEEEKENQQLSGRILEGLMEIARQIARAEGFTVILERSSAGVIFAEEALDLTDRVVREYNQKNPGGSAK